MPHIHEKIDFVNAAYLVHDRRVLLVHHKKDGLWLAPGGHVELDEDTDEAVVREIGEETGLDHANGDYFILEPGFRITYGSGWSERDNPGWAEMDHAANHNVRHLYAPWRMNIHDVPNKPGHRHIVLIYLCRATTDEVRLESDAHHAIRWFSQDDLYFRQSEDGSQSWPLIDEIRLNALDAIDVVGGR